jgi:TRAP transporter TAXI family solute receptor
MRRRLTYLLAGSIVAVAALIGLAAANRFAGPLPPRKIVMSTGREGGAYYEFAREYQRRLAREGFTLEIETGAGSIETLRRLKSGEATIGFVQGGAAATVDADGLVSLASVFYEPLWVFHRKTVPVSYLADLRGRRVAVGEEGSGTRVLALQVLTDSSVTAKNTTFVGPTSDEAEAALVGGRIDAAFFVLSPRAELVARLLRHPDVVLLSERQALAYAGRYPFITSIKIGEGMLDVARNIPRGETTVLAVTASLVARADIHPDLVRLLLGTAEKVHRRGGLLEHEGMFPSETLVELPLHDGARRYLRNGPPWLERVFPFWAAGLLDRTMLVVLPMVTVLFPMFGLFIPMLDRRRRRRIARWYEQLRDCEVQSHALSLNEIDEQAQELRDLQQTVTAAGTLPPLYMGELYNLKMHIGIVLTRLEERRRVLLEERAPAATSRT